MIVTDFDFDVNDLDFQFAPTMQIDIRPDERLAPVIASSADQLPALTYLAGLGKSSQRPQMWALRAVAAILTGGECNPLTLPWHLLRRQHVNAVRAKLIDHYSVATGQRYMAALRGTLKEAWRLGLMTAEDYHRTIDVKSIRGQSREQAAGRALSAGEIAALINACQVDPSAAGPRDAAMLGLGVRCGLRRAEIASLQIDDYQPANGKLTVTGKGRKTRTVYVGPGVDSMLADWLHLRGAIPGYLFLAINKGGRILTAGISDVAVYVAMAKRARQAGVNHFSPHDLRRTFAGDMLDAGADIATLQKMMGHASATTTAGYDRRGERAKREAAGRLHLPWQRRFEDKP